ncbi:adrenocorticotropic hormone receptor [Pimephales promelas]|nr:adrenocorticotropic hormone receptor [Pimephales promelas]
MSNLLLNASLFDWDVLEGRNTSPVPSWDLEPVPMVLNPWDVLLCVTGTLMSCENAVVIALISYTPTLRAPMFVLIGMVTLLSAGLLITAFSASVLNILAITVDRYLSLYNALSYHTESTVTFTYVTLVLLWGRQHFAGVAPGPGLELFGRRKHLYLQICKIAFRHAQQIAVQRQFMSASHSTSTTKGVSTLTTILGTFAFCWIPLAMYSLVADTRSPVIYTYATALPAICHSIINPMIYAFRNPEILRSLRIACCGCMPYRFPMRPRTPSDV